MMTFTCDGRWRMVSRISSRSRNLYVTVYVISSRMTSWKSPDSNFSLAISQARCAVALSFSRLSLSQVKPSPMGITSNCPGANLAAIRTSPGFHFPLMNCTIHTRQPCPMARKAVPRAAVVLPLPLPVLRITRFLRSRRGFSSMLYTLSHQGYHPLHGLLKVVIQIGIGELRPTDHHRRHMQCRGGRQFGLKPPGGP